jgi:acetolactate synthase-1/3 small subunit
MKLADVFRARIVDVAPDSLILETTGTEEKIAGLLEVLRPFGVLEVARTGNVAMSRGTPSRVPDRMYVETEQQDESGISCSV